MFKLLENENLDVGTVGFIYKVSYGPTEASWQNRLMFNKSAIFQLQILPYTEIPYLK